MTELYKVFFTNPIIIILLVASIIIIVTYYLFGIKLLGLIGEHWTKEALSKLPKDTYKIINDVLIKTSTGTHQIDHIVVSKYGIFVIETKQYNGYITGSKWDKHWIRHAGKRKLYYENPIRQNYGHVKSLQELLNIEENKLINLVCIPSNAKLKIKHDGELVNNLNIVKTITSYKEVIVNNTDTIINIIKTINITDKEIRKEHIKNIKKKTSK